MDSAIEVGRVCVKTHGRFSGSLCVITAILDKSFVEVTGPKELTGIKRKRANMDHLEPTKHKVAVKEKATDKAVLEAIEKAGLSELFGAKAEKKEKKE